ncbi:hypothetical protein TNCV_4010211 [Trichonephila clavipes]|nr:hypothetical protein TNCV_4010211 [Trichonephila clavipes]
MTSHYGLDDSLRWRIVIRREAGQTLVEVARGLQVARKRSPSYGINSKQVVLSPGRPTTAPQATPDLTAVPRRRISKQTVYIRLAETDLYTRRQGIQQERPDIEDLRTHQLWTPQEWGSVLFRDELKCT